jgi:thiamine-monophosphate kinase
MMERNRTAGSKSGNRHLPELGNELALLARIRARVASAGSNRKVRLGIGDDCALVDLKPGEEMAVTTDLSIAGRHFELAWHPPEAIGRRVLARGLSDLAAMGARPVAAFLSLGLPKGLTATANRSHKTGNRSLASGHRFTRAETASKINQGFSPWIDCFYDGLLALAREFHTPLAGGDLAESPIAVADVVLLGAVLRGKALLRSGARPGNAIYVTGSLGGAAAGLEMLKELAATQKPSATSGLRIPQAIAAQLARHLCPLPRVRQGLWLAKHGMATAAIDVSDGLSTDLRHLCDESGVAAELVEDALPVSTGARLTQALHGGEDYELLFTARPNARLPRKIAGVAVTRIGHVMKRSAKCPILTLVTTQGREALQAHGWEHFA